MASASMLQVMAVMSGCHKTAYQCNLTNSGDRQDFYTNLVSAMNKYLSKDKWIGLDENLTRNDVKGAAVPYFYGSKAEPKRVFGEDTEELDAFYKALEDLVPGAIEVMAILRTCWNNQALVHQFTMLDGHIAYIPVTDLVKKRIEIDELNHKTFTYQTVINMPSNHAISILANVIQGAGDSYLAREVIRRCDKQGFKVLTIHDSYHTHPNNMQQLREVYQQVLIDMCNSNMLEDIYNQLKGTNDTYEKVSETLADEIKEAEYFLS